MKAYWGYGGIIPRILDLGTRCRWVVGFTPRPLYNQGKSPWYWLAMRLFSTRWWREKFPAPTKTQTPGHPARSPELYHWAIPDPYEWNNSDPEFRFHTKFWSVWSNIRRCIQKFPDWVDKDIYAYIVNTRCYPLHRDMTAKLSRLNSDTTAPSGRQLYHLQFSLQVASPEIFGYIHVSVSQYIGILHALSLMAHELTEVKFDLCWPNTTPLTEYTV
jgi:hypothetical protein